METTTSQKELELCKENLRVDICATYPKDWNGDFNKYFIHFRIKCKDNTHEDDFNIHPFYKIKMTEYEKSMTKFVSENENNTITIVIIRGYYLFINDIDYEKNKIMCKIKNKYEMAQECYRCLQSKRKFCHCNI